MLKILFFNSSFGILVDSVVVVDVSFYSYTATTGGLSPSNFF